MKLLDNHRDFAFNEKIKLEMTKGEFMLLLTAVNSASKGNIESYFHIFFEESAEKMLLQYFADTEEEDEGYLYEFCQKLYNIATNLFGDKIR